MELLTPSFEISESYFEALEKGYVDKSRGKKITKELSKFLKNPPRACFLAWFSATSDWVSVAIRAPAKRRAF